MILNWNIFLWIGWFLWQRKDFAQNLLLWSLNQSFKVRLIFFQTISFIMSQYLFHIYFIMSLYIFHYVTIYSLYMFHNVTLYYIWKKITMVKVSRVNISSMEVVQSSFDQHSVPRRKKRKKKRREKTSNPKKKSGPKKKKKKNIRSQEEE